MLLSHNRRGLEGNHLPLSSSCFSALRLGFLAEILIVSEQKYLSPALSIEISGGTRSEESAFPSFFVVFILILSVFRGFG